jgi:hypothetical protein
MGVQNAEAALSAASYAETVKSTLLVRVFPDFLSVTVMAIL